MFFQKRGQKYSFQYYDPDRKICVRLRRSEGPEVSSPEEAQAYCDEWNRKHETTKQMTVMKNRWRELYPEFVEKLKTYAFSRKEEAEHSWETNVYYLSCYVFPYFLEIMQLTEIDSWHYKFESFRDHIQRVPRMKRSEKRTQLSYSTMNGVIKALNSFVLTMYRRNHSSESHKCRLFPKSKCRMKGEESVLSDTQQWDIYQALLRKSFASAEMFWVGLQTGLRLNELLGLSLGDFYSGPIQNEALQTCMSTFPMKSYGFLVLDSQPKQKLGLRNELGEVPRKPLKGKKRISGANSRIIPIFDSKCFDILVCLWNYQRDFYAERKVYGLDPRNYLLFHNLDRKIYYTALIEVQKDLGFERHFTPHDTRHTYSTWLAEKSGGNFALCKMILGHSCLETTFQYVHMSARIQNDLKSQIQLRMPMSFSDDKLETVPLFPGNSHSKVSGF